jgi:hypothetical protein
MTLVHIGIFTAGVVAGWILAKNQKKDSTFANYANLAAPGDLRKDWEYCTKKCYSDSNGGYDCLKKCMKARSNTIN